MVATISNVESMAVFSSNIQPLVAAISKGPWTVVPISNVKSMAATIAKVIATLSIGATTVVTISNGGDHLHVGIVGFDQFERGIHGYDHC